MIVRFRSTFVHIELVNYSTQFEESDKKTESPIRRLNRRQRTTERSQAPFLRVCLTLASACSRRFNAPFFLTACRSGGQTHRSETLYLSRESLSLSPIRWIGGATAGDATCWIGFRKLRPLLVIAMK